MTYRGFASDNNAGVHPQILRAIAAANDGHVVAYGDDRYTARAVDAFRAHFGAAAEVCFVFNGTGANVLGLQSITRSYNAVICTESAHIHFDECGAPERIAGVKLLTCEALDGKLTVERVARHMHGFGDQHHIQPKVISITQSTELGTLYTPDEVRTLADHAHAHGMLLHMDGARICNAAVALDLPFRAFTSECGVDVLSFGGTKNGLLGAEAVVLFPSALGSGEEQAEAGRAHLRFLRKQDMQLASKMRFLAAQFEALLSTDLWRCNAANANAMARRLAQAVRGIPGLAITNPVQANAVFAALPKRCIPALQERHFFYEWADVDAERTIVRWMCAWDTTEDDVDRFAAFVKEVLGTG
jgi:threonine aldolase